MDEYIKEVTPMPESTGMWVYDPTTDTLRRVRCNATAPTAYTIDDTIAVYKNIVHPKRTNAERIRAMSDEKMATYLLGMIANLCEDGLPARDFILNWLREPAKEDE